MNKMSYLILVLSLLISTNGYSYTETCNCSNAVCAYCSHGAITPHLQTVAITGTPDYTPDSDGYELLNQYHHESVFIQTENESGSNMCGTEHPSVQVYQNRTVSLTGTIGVKYNAAAEVSFEIVKITAGYTLDFQVSGSLSVQQGTIVSDTVDHDFILPPGKATLWKAKFYKDYNSVSVTGMQRHLCHDAWHCGVQQGYLWPDHYTSVTGTGTSEKYTRVTLSYQGIVDI